MKLTFQLKHGNVDYNLSTGVVAGVLDISFHQDANCSAVVFLFIVFLVALVEGHRHLPIDQLSPRRGIPETFHSCSHRIVTHGENHSIGQDCAQTRAW